MIRIFTLEDLNSINQLLTSHTWTFHTDTQVDSIKGETYFSSNSNKTLVYKDSNGRVAGYIRFFDIVNSDTDSVLFDIRVDEQVRGQGIGSELVEAGVKYIFDSFDQVRRIEATTREDNIAMQKVLERLGFTQEARYRKAWKIDTDDYADALGYGILRGELK